MVVKSIIDKKNYQATSQVRICIGKNVTAPSITKSDDRVDFGVGLRRVTEDKFDGCVGIRGAITGPKSKSDSILRSTQDKQRELNAYCKLQDFNTIYNLMNIASRSNREKNVELHGCGPEDWVKLGNSLAKVCRIEADICGGLDCVLTLARQH